MADMTLSEARQALMLDAIYELSKLSAVLPNLVPLDESQNHYAVKGVAGRLSALSQQLLLALADEHHTDKEMATVINFFDLIDFPHMPA